MLVVAGHVRIDPANRAGAVAAAKAMMEETRKEAGCRSYTFSADLEEEGLFHIFEEWDSPAALDAHFRTPHMARFQKEVAGFGVREMKVKRYEIAKVGPLGG